MGFQRVGHYFTFTFLSFFKIKTKVWLRATPKQYTGSWGRGLRHVIIFSEIYFITFFLRNFTLYTSLWKKRAAAQRRQVYNHKKLLSFRGLFSENKYYSLWVFLLSVPCFFFFFFFNTNTSLLFIDVSWSPFYITLYRNTFFFPCLEFYSMDIP